MKEPLFSPSDEQLRAYAAGSLPAREMDRIAAQLFADPVLEAKFIELTATGSDETAQDLDDAARFKDFQQRLATAGWVDRSKPSVAKIWSAPLRYALAAAIVLLLAIAGMLLYQQPWEPRQRQMARASEVVVEVSPRMSADDAWITHYYEKNWSAVVADLQPSMDSVLAQGSADFSHTVCKQLLVLGSALLQRNPRQPAEAAPYLQAAASQITDLSLAREAGFYLGLMEVLSGNTAAGFARWEAIREEGLPPRYLAEIDRIMNSR